MLRRLSSDPAQALGCQGFRVWGLGFRGLGFRGLGFRVRVSPPVRTHKLPRMAASTEPVLSQREPEILERVTSTNLHMTLTLFWKP